MMDLKRRDGLRCLAVIKKYTDDVSSNRVSSHTEEDHKYKTEVSSAVDFTLRLLLSLACEWPSTSSLFTGSSLVQPACKDSSHIELERRSP